MCLCLGFIVSELQLSPTKGAIISLLQVFKEVVLEASGAWSLAHGCSVLCLGYSVGDGIQDLVQARQVLYHEATSPIQDMLGFAIESGFQVIYHLICIPY